MALTVLATLFLSGRPIMACIPQTEHSCNRGIPDLICIDASGLGCSHCCSPNPSSFCLVLPSSFVVQYTGLVHAERPRASELFLTLAVLH